MSYYTRRNALIALLAGAMPSAGWPRRCRTRAHPNSTAKHCATSRQAARAADRSRSTTPIDRAGWQPSPPRTSRPDASRSSPTTRNCSASWTRRTRTRSAPRIARPAQERHDHAARNRRVGSHRGELLGRRRHGRNCLRARRDRRRRNGRPVRNVHGDRVHVPAAARNNAAVDNPRTPVFASWSDSATGRLTADTSCEEGRPGALHEAPRQAEDP